MKKMKKNIKKLEKNRFYFTITFPFALMALNVLSPANLTVNP